MYNDGNESPNSNSDIDRNYMMIQDLQIQVQGFEKAFKLSGLDISSYEKNIID